MKKDKLGLAWRFDHRERQYISEVLDSGFASSTSGSMNTRLEKAFAERFGSKFAITFNSGTTTLHAALEAFGVGYGDEVIVTPLTVISCMNAILYCGAIPVFADIDKDTFLIDPEDIKRKITNKTKAIMPVHLYGQVCDMTQIMQIANDHDLFVLEDCAQCYLGTHKGALAGTIGHVGSWSFENSKHLTCGDGGIITANDEALADKIRKLNCQGFRTATAINGKIRVSKDTFQDPAFKRHDSFGYMYRLPEVAAAMALGQLEKIDWFINKRTQMAEMYTEVIEASNCNYLIPQKAHYTLDKNCYYAFAMKFNTPDITWQQFRKKHIENGGDGIYAAWTLCYQEDSVPHIKKRLSKMGLKFVINTNCPVAENVQRKIMQLTTNQRDEEEMKIQAEALDKTIKYFK
tara:strand:- start:886 stop:2097 length:1212 start_codon:yes stop_codon:yes gene_type:complete